MFHVWRSFHFDENTETVHIYVTHTSQVAALLESGEPQVLDVFKNTLPSRLYWVLFPIEDLRQALETAKRFLTKGKIDRQLVGISTCTPFMSIKDSFGHDRREVLFDNQSILDSKIDKITAMM